MPSIEIVRGRTSRWLSRCSRSQASSVDGRRRLQVGDLDQPHLAGHPAYVVRPGQRGQLGRRVAPVGSPERGRREPGVQHGAALVEGDQGVAPRVRRCLAHAGDSTERACRHPPPRVTPWSTSCRRRTPGGSACRPSCSTEPRPDDLLDVVRHLTVLQAEPTAPLGAPSADLVLWSRLGSAYDRAELVDLVDRQVLIEHQGFVRPSEDLALFRAEMSIWPGREPLRSGSATTRGGSRPTTAAGARSSTSCGGRGRCRPARSTTPARCPGRPRAGTTTATSRCCSS